MIQRCPHNVVATGHSYYRRTGRTDRTAHQVAEGREQQVLFQRNVKHVSWQLNRVSHVVLQPTI